MRRQVPSSAALVRMLAALLWAAALVCLVAVTAPAGAVAGRFVSPDGSDAGNDCADRDTPCATLSHALDMADNGETIFVEKGIYTDFIKTDMDITFEGAGAADTIVQADASNPVFYLGGGAVTIRDLTIRHGANDDCGGGIFSQGQLALADTIVGPNRAASGGGVCIDNGTLSISGGQLVSNSATLNGGGLYVGTGTAEISGAHILSNTSGAAGGGVYIRSAAALTGTQVTANQAISGGGVAVASASGQVQLVDTTVDHNHASNGGGLYGGHAGARLSMTGGGVNHNSASGNGGGVYVYAGWLRLEEAEARGNVAANGGGAYVWQGELHLQSSQVVSNSATGSGGGMVLGQWAGSASLPTIGVLTDTMVLSNSAASGGGIDVRHVMVTLQMGGGQVRANRAITEGGGILHNSGTSMISGTQVVSNVASGASAFGGGMRANYGALYAINVSLNGNQAAYGGGLATLNPTLVHLSGGALVDNRASQNGGGLYQSLSQVQMVGTHIERNQATWYGGGALVANGLLLLTDTWILTNSAYSGGGLQVDQAGGAVVMSGGGINSNAADSYGGGLHSFMGSAIISGAQVISNWAPAGGGANGGALYQSGYDRITIQQSCIYSNTTASVVAGVPVLTATHNWWGAADGPSGAGPGSGDTVSAGVVYSPFLTTRPAACSRLAGSVYLPLAVKDS